jgi:TusA-related sulfurtransferase
LGEPDFLRRTDAEERSVNIFGTVFVRVSLIDETMPAVEEHVTDTEAPPDRPHETMDARDLPPPQPLQNTLERLVELDDETVLVQLNDRAPQHLYPKLADRGYQYETLDTELGVITVIWLPSE